MKNRKQWTKRGYIEPCTHLPTHSHYIVGVDESGGEGIGVNESGFVYGLVF